jgi:hypothetical protein
MKTFKIAGPFLLAIITLVIVSCKKDNTVESPDLSRNFRPTAIAATASGTNVKLVWNPSQFSAGKGVKYTVEISKDSTFKASVMDYTGTTDSAMITVTDDKLTPKQKYFARVKANASGSTAESAYAYSPSFTILGEQIFIQPPNGDLSSKTAKLKWTAATGLTNIVVTPAGGTGTSYPITAAELTAREKTITGLTGNVTYTAEIFAGTKSKGVTTFTTPVYNLVVSPSDNLVTAVANAADGDIIGLNPGTYDTKDAAGAYVNLLITQKTVTLQSVSGNPKDTKVNFKEITLKGTGAGVTLKGIEFDGLAATPAAAAYFINLVGMASDAEASNFKSITVDNCIVHNMGNCFFRGNRGGNNAHKMEDFKVNNSVIYDNQTVAAYSFFTMDKMEFKRLELTNSTFYNMGRAMISWSTAITVATKPVILIDKCTMNNWGSDGRDYILVDATSNLLSLTIQNSIFANTPKAGGAVGSNAVRGTNANNDMKFINNDTFKFTGGATTVAPLAFPAAVQQAGNKTVDLGWTATTTDFSIPAGSELRTASTTGGAIGDPRWVK